MGMIRALGRFLRYILGAYEWARGRRPYPWASSPPHRLFALIANRAYGWPGAHYRALYAVAGGLLKYRERLHGDRINFAAQLRAPVNAETLRNAALWQRAIQALPPMVPHVHANIMVQDSSRVQLDRLMSVLFMCDNLRTINIFFDEGAVRAARLAALTVAEENRGWEMDAFDLNARHSVPEDASESVGWSAIFSNRTGFDRNVNNYLKIAHPGAFVVALGLPESDDGFCDEWLPAWREALQSLQSPIENLSFVVLNAVSPQAGRAASASVRESLAFARKAGLSLAETICLARKADAFVGRMDVYGLAARAAQRPGVYLSAGTRESFEAQSGILDADASPAEAVERLQKLLAELPKRAERTIGSSAAGTIHSGQHAAGAPVRREEIRQKYTLLIPTYNRPELLERLLRYLERARAPFDILVLDSSTPEMQLRNKRAIESTDLKVSHAIFDPSMDPYVKMRAGLQSVRTPFCSICADDDVVLVDSIQHCVETLERDAKAVVAHGYYFNFRENQTFNLSYVVYKGKSVDQVRPLGRLRALFAAYEAVLYGVFRTEAAVQAFRDVHRMDTVLGKELLTAALTLIAGKAVRIGHFYYGRNTAESLSYTAWHPHQILAEQPGLMFEQYPLFRSLLLERLREVDPAVPEVTAAKIIDLILLRYLQPFLRHDVLDVMLDMSLRGQEPAAIVTKIWDFFVRTTRPDHPEKELLDASGRFSPSQLGAGRPRDYAWEDRTWDGRNRKYLVFYEFLFPDVQPAAFTEKEQIVSLVQSLNAY